MTPVFVGDLSVNDADILSKLSSGASRILEFGVGGSTQIFAQTAPEDASIISVDTDTGWISRTEENLVKLDACRRVKFLAYDKMLAEIEGRQFDLIFDDGRDDLRLEFARIAWDRLNVGGLLVFHDTRRIQDMANVLIVANEHYLEVDTIEVNVSNSNLTTIRKKVAEPYVNWNYVEGRAPWMWGDGPPPDGWPTR